MSADSERRRKRQRKMIAILTLFPLTLEDIGLDTLVRLGVSTTWLGDTKKHGNALIEANILRVAPILLDGRFAEAERVSKEMGLKENPQGP